MTITGHFIADNSKNEGGESKSRSVLKLVGEKIISERPNRRFLDCV